MTKIDAERVFKLQITDIFDEEQVIEYISKIQKHPNVLNPSRIVREGTSSWLYYNVSQNGMTLRALIEKKPLHHNRLTNRLFHFMKIDPYKIILQLIDAYEFMLNNNLLLGQSNINPDCIWVEHEEHSTQLKVYVINTIETIVICKSLNDKNYWSPELFSKYKAVTFYPIEMEHHPLVNHLITKQTTTNKLVRYNTRPSTLTSVYSLGLIMYYIVTHNDPFEGHRLFADDKPYMSEIQKELNDCITIALECDIRERPTLQQYREIINSNQKKSKRRKCTIL